MTVHWRPISCSVVRRRRPVPARISIGSTGRPSRGDRNPKEWGLSTRATSSQGSAKRDRGYSGSAALISCALAAASCQAIVPNQTIDSRLVQNVTGPWVAQTQRGPLYLFLVEKSGEVWGG